MKTRWKLAVLGTRPVWRGGTRLSTETYVIRSYGAWQNRSKAVARLEQLRRDFNRDMWDQWQLVKVVRK